jgi:multicomponent Na+:H+ antiporter subunit D
MFGNIIVPPFLPMLLGALLLPLLPKAVRSAACVVFPFLSLTTVWLLPDGSLVNLSFLDYTLLLCQTDQLSRVFGIIFAMVAVAGAIYAYHINDTGQQVAALTYAGSSLGVTFAGDYFTLLIFWELMAVSSTYLVWARRTQEARGAGMRYLLVHLFGGSMLLAGILLHFHQTNSLMIVRFFAGESAAPWLILGGVALNAAIPPLNAWLPDAYPRATVTGAVFLSAFTTKTAVYMLARVFAGWEILLVLGTIMTLYGVVYAVLSNDIRNILAYHIISQVGFMVAGVGIGTEMALNGSVAHAFSHILYKALLFMGAGLVLETTGTSKLSELGGLYRQQQWGFWLYMVGAFSISGVPLFNGFISKSMVVSAAGEAHLVLAEKLLHLASIGTFLSIALKLPYGTWFGRETDIRVRRAPRNMYVGMGVTSFLCIMFGVAPSLLYDLLPFPVRYEPFTIPHIIEAVQMLGLTFVAFWLLRSKFVPEAKITLDTDWFYRYPAPFIRTVAIDAVGRVFDEAEKLSLGIVGMLAQWSRNPSHLGPTSVANKEYGPDKARPAMQVVIGLVIGLFVCVAILSLIIH